MSGSEDTDTALLQRPVPVEADSRKRLTKTAYSSLIPPGGPIERDDEKDPGQHWHQPLLPHERRRPAAAIAAALRGLGLRLRAIGRSVAAVPAAWERRAHSRVELAELSEYALRDIGLTRADVVRETSKPFWRD